MILKIDIGDRPLPFLYFSLKGWLGYNITFYIAAIDWHDPSFVSHSLEPAAMPGSRLVNKASYKRFW